VKRCALILILLCFSTILVFSASVQSLQSELEAVQKALDQAGSRLNSLKSSEQQNKVLINQLKSNISNGHDAYNSANFQVIRASAYIEASQEKLSENRPLVNNLQIDLAYNLVKYYQLKELSPPGLKDFSRYQEINLLKKIILKEQSILSDLGSVQSQWQSVKQQNEMMASEQQALIVELESKQAGYQSLISSKNSEIQKLEKDKVAIQKQISGLEKREASLEEQIASIIKNSSGTYQVSKKSTSTSSHSNQTTTIKNGMITPNMNSNQISQVLGKMLVPIKGRTILNFGEQKNLNYGVKSTSRGLEILSTTSMPVQAAWAGKVIYAAPLSSLGTVVVLDNGTSVATVYGNLSSSSVSVGDIIKQGTTLGYLSSSDRGAILYYEVRFKGIPINPSSFM